MIGSASDWFTVINIVSVVSVVIKHDQVYVSIIYCDINCNQVLYIVLLYLSPLSHHDLPWNLVVGSVVPENSGNEHGVAARLRMDII